MFISYSHKDEDWVRGDLLQQLEARNLQVCIDFRDFQVGAPSVQEMRRAVETSRKTLLVLTPDYLNSAWTEFEVAILQTIDPNNRQRRLIPLRKAECQLPPEISYLNYVDLANPKYSDVEWKKLMMALGATNDISLPPPPAPPALPDPDGSAEAGLVALRVLMRDPAVRANVASFETVFRTSCQQIDVLAYYKDLHDLLHTLQFKCYNYIIGIVRSAKKSPTDVSIWEDLIDSELALQDVVDGLNNFMEQGASGSERMNPWIGLLINGLRRLFIAIENRDAQNMDEAIKPINSVLAIQPALINARLNQAARSLPLPELIEALIRVFDNLDVARVNLNAMEKFRTGVNALYDLNNQLSALRDEHDLWQAVDAELRRIEATVAQDLDDLSLSWPNLKKMTEKQCKGVLDEWAQKLQVDCQKLDEAFEAQEPNKVRQYFGRYRSRVSNRFYHVDLMLRELCGKLRGVGEPLNTILGEM